MEFVGFLLFMLIMGLVLDMFGGSFNIAWLLCFICVYRWFVEGVGIYCVPASVFAIAASIMSLKQGGDKHDKN